MRKHKEKKLIRLAHLFAALILTLSILVPSFVEVGSSVWTANSAIAAESTADLADKKWITSLDIETKQNGQWVAYDGSKPLADGSNVTATLNFKIPMGSLTGSGSKVTYQFPDGFKIDKEQKGDYFATDENGSRKLVGTYTISTDGKAEITFNENFDPKITYPKGTLSVSGTLENSSSSSEKTLNFPGVSTTIPIQKKNNGDTDHDIKVEKHGTVADDKKSVSYTVKVTTTKGTPDTVKLEDTLTYVNNATGRYDKGSFKIVKEDASGQKTELSTSKYQPTISTNSGNQPTFKIAGLPKLDKGESYEITYSVKIDPKDNTIGGIGNSVHAKSKDKEAWGGDNKQISNRLIHKKGKYNNGQIDWTINVNDAQADISHYKLTDSLPDNASLLDDIKLVDTSTGKKYDISSLIVKGKKGDKEISVDFSKLPDKYKKDTFKITYTTKAPEASDRSVDVNNSVDFHDSTHHYSDSAKVKVPAANYGIAKKFDSEEAISGNSEEKRYNWRSTFKLSGKELDTLDYTDSIQKATSTNEHDSTAKEQDEESHYGVASELYKELTDPDKQKLLVEEGSQVTKKYVLGEHYEVELWFFDKDNKQIDKTDSKTPVRYFQLRVVPKDGKTIKPTKFVIHYSTHANIGKVNPGETWTYKNVGDFSYFNNEQIAERDSDSHSYKNRKLVVKQASLTGMGNSYQGTDQKPDFDKTDGTIYYRILLTIPKDSTGEIDVTDILPKGMTYKDGSLTAGFYNKDNEYWADPRQYWDGRVYDLAGDQKPNVSTTKQADGTTKLNIILPDGYRSSDSDHTIQLTYTASVKDDETWLDMNNTQKSYTNTVSWNGYTDQQTTTETREVSVLKKKGGSDQRFLWQPNQYG